MTTTTSINWSKIQNYAVLAGSVIIATEAVVRLTSVKADNLKAAIFPVVTLLVGITAFNYALSQKQNIG